jgi:ribosomal protein S18 acetylase RimI-like enzyme
MIDKIITIRKATSLDVNQAAILLQQAMTSFGDHIFGNGDQDKSLIVLKKLFLARENRFNYRYSFLAEKGNQIAGLLLAFRSNLMTRLDLFTGQQLLRILRPGEMLQLVMRVIRLPVIQETGKDEFYISDLAVTPEFRGQRIGSTLLDFAEEQARKLELKKCSLIVTKENEGARRLYLTKGYKIIDFVQNSSIFDRKIRMGHYRMVKEV